jgi:peptidoglycan/xylan/chitin deacetylase (PgdA/CDA1 family)
MAMLRSITLKRGIKRAAGWASVALSPLVDSSRDGAAVCILMYHRIARIGFVDQRVDDWNVPPDIFERQMHMLATHATVVPLTAFISRAAAEAAAAVAPAMAPSAAGSASASAMSASQRVGERPLACVTVDDGYASAFVQALPILVRYGIPATFFVPTAYVDSHEPMPFDRWGRLNRSRVTPDTWRAATWRDLERAAKSGLVTIGSHSHQHLEGRVCDGDRLREEVERSRDELIARLGAEHARTYAYPYGNSRLGDVPAAYEDAVRAAGFELAVTTDPALARASGSSNPFRLPRLEIHQLDSSAVLRAKLRGSLAPYRAIDRLRPAH